MIVFPSSYTTPEFNTYTINYLSYNLSPMIAVREEQNDKSEVYPLKGVEQLVLNQRLRDMAWEGKEGI